ncbi:dihydrolipoyl dehydrogenase [Buchnera aphidicola (Formosaphis micheliae)]|uniref:dihydrolipoyl dehydrogenase n=1 Tax=Buchnera aphidicola TaxID=9 RepID=UPI0031B82793
MYHTQVVIIGAGPAGYSAAFRCADLGLQTTLIEAHSNKLGGVCLNVGCIPSKSLLHIAKVIMDARKLSSSGIEFNQPVINIKKICKWKDNIVNDLNFGLMNLVKQRNIKVFFGKAKFLSTTSILIESNKENIVISFDHVIIATGSYARELSDVVTCYDHRIWNSSSALELREIPKKLLVVGGGIIGLEMATIYSALGSKVDVIESGVKLLPMIDQDIIDIFMKSISGRFEIILNSCVSKVVPHKTGISVNIENNHKPYKIVDYDVVLIAIGRQANFDDLNIDKIGIKINQFGCIQVNQQLRTNIPNVYAIGDVVGSPMLAHKGIHEGHIAAEVISGKNHFFSPKVIPCVAYTDPEIAWVGITEMEAKKNNLNYKIAKFPWSASGRALTSHSTIGLTKLIFSLDSNRIIGGEIVGSNASELLSEISLAIEMGCDAEDISLTIHAHPTLNESIGLAAEIFTGTITDLINTK